MRCWQVAIVGGGPGGLFTAYLLEKLVNAPLKITLFEGTDRLGGKILTPRFQAIPARYEAGAAEFYDYTGVADDPLKELVEELGLFTIPLAGSAVVMEGQIVGNLDDLSEKVGQEARASLAAFDRQARDAISPAEYYFADHADRRSPARAEPRFEARLSRIPSRAARRYIESLIHSDLATEPACTSDSYGLQNYLMNDARYMHLYCLEGGNERLPQELAARLAANVRLGQAVTRIGRGADGRLAVACESNGSEREETFDFVVLAVPHNGLSQIEFAGARLAAAMQAHRERYNHPAHYLRISILFERPFWRAHLADSYLMLDAFGGCCLYDETARIPWEPYGVLGWLLGGEAASTMSRESDGALIERALDSLPPALGAGRPHFLEGRVHRWLCAVNAIPGGLEPLSLDRRHLPEPCEHSDLFVVGDYLFDSTLNGVLDSAYYVAEWLAARMADGPSAHTPCPR